MFQTLINCSSEFCQLLKFCCRLFKTNSLVSLIFDIAISVSSVSNWAHLTCELCATREIIKQDLTHRVTLIVHLCIQLNIYRIESNIKNSFFWSLQHIYVVSCLSDIHKTCNHARPAPVTLSCYFQAPVPKPGGGRPDRARDRGYTS